jgi:two-component system, response regulator PdtaR
MAQKRIIIAEDETLIRMNLRLALVDLGYVVVGEAGDGASAINLARSLKPDLVVMDIKMPRLDGIDACNVLLEERVAPVVLLTAHNGPEYVSRARAAGVGAYLLKPFREADLMPAIEIAMARYAELLTLDKQLADTREALDARKVVERAKGLLMQRHGIDEAEAFRRIEQGSATTGKSMREVAQALLLASDV